MMSRRFLYPLDFFQEKAGSVPEKFVAKNGYVFDLIRLFRSPRSD
jgi:hypothetical protein